VSGRTQLSGFSMTCISITVMKKHLIMKQKVPTLLNVGVCMKGSKENSSSLKHTFENVGLSI